MKYLKSLLATIIAFLCCYYWGEFSGFTSFSFAYILHFVLMPWYVYLDSLFKWKYNFSYFQTKKFEKEGAIYKLIGVNLYRKLLVWCGWERISRKEIKISGRKSAIELAEYKSRSSEAGHTLLFLMVTFITFLIADNLREALWLVVLNVVINLYPILVQRYNRPRYKRALEIIETRSFKGN
ncbi:hypothetical protein [Salinimicrobium sp. HB62]|uniref:glycosyl-4,4'-diaponeurosporenoate acyltransferase CrtO family protein n=1 Tax=Salinimicrobium sp. HB62 TaxID=3077781 RepID=UPI002D78FAEC|nr:hypothetical protein [Salinimicrobium sp. HB62]